MSKAFAFAGARVGYLAADPGLIDALRLVRLPYHLSSLTQAAATAALQHAAVMLAMVDEIVGQRERISATIAALDYEPYETWTNFVLFGGLADAPATWRALYDRGVLIRDVGIPGHLRVTAGTEAETTAFLDCARVDRLGRMRPDQHRTATLRRATSESTVELDLDLDGTGKSRIDTTVPFFDHLLTAFAKHSLTDLTVRAAGDTDIDAHHTVEDVAIVLGDALREALGDKGGISRYGDALVPLDEALAQAVVDLSGPPLPRARRRAGRVRVPPDRRPLHGVARASHVRGDRPPLGDDAACAAACPVATRITSPRRSTRPSRARSVRPRHWIPWWTGSPSTKGAL